MGATVKIVRRGRCTALLLDSGGARIVFVDLPETMSEATRDALNELAVRALEAVKREIEEKK